MTLHIVAVKDYWAWVIRDDIGGVVEESTIRFHSAATAESRGQTRIRQFESAPEDAAGRAVRASNGMSPTSRVRS
jgi:hypothetical protein